MITREELAKQLLESFEQFHKHGGQLTLTVNDRTVGIEIPTGCSYATIDKLLCDAIERIDRMISD